MFASPLSGSSVSNEVRIYLAWSLLARTIVRAKSLSCLFVGGIVVRSLNLSCWSSHSLLSLAFSCCRFTSLLLLQRKQDSRRMKTKSLLSSSFLSLLLLQRKRQSLRKRKKMKRNSRLSLASSFCRFYRESDTVSGRERGKRNYRESSILILLSPASNDEAIDSAILKLTIKGLSKRFSLLLLFFHAFFRSC